MAKAMVTLFLFGDSSDPELPLKCGLARVTARRAKKNTMANFMLYGLSIRLVPYIGTMRTISYLWSRVAHEVRSSSCYARTDHSDKTVSGFQQRLRATESKNAVVPTTTVENPTFVPITTEESPTFGPVTTEKQPTFPSFTTVQSPTIAPVTTVGNPTFGPVTTEENPTFGPVTTEESPTFVPVTTEEDPSSAPFTTEQGITFVPVTPEENPTIVPVTTEESFVSSGAPSDPTESGPIATGGLATSYH
ncbi:hypothetical protein TELCIR_04021 [Teladorsagia circumcincta]|uniref:Uncharacterized protein n=1 Tax=Teladorsagia circumcincta TaxID=45464 RepID=A0A2G9UUQ3_TELCI|nr:hypothetical protein TELCIR_04021 [Teladorsagia circumcincta]